MCSAALVPRFFLENTMRILPLALIAIGVFGLLKHYGLIDPAFVQLFWPLLLIGIGVAMLVCGPRWRAELMRVRYSVTIEDGEGGSRPGRRFHILYRRARQVVRSRSVETVALELKMGDMEGVGWAVAVAAAACFAERGEGLIQADGEGYLEPSANGVEHVLDGD